MSFRLFLLLVMFCLFLCEKFLQDIGDHLAVHRVQFYYGRFIDYVFCIDLAFFQLFGQS